VFHSHRLHKHVKLEEIKKTKNYEGVDYEGWFHVSQKYINEKVSTMPERLKAEEGRMNRLL